MKVIDFMKLSFYKPYSKCYGEIKFWEDEAMWRAGCEFDASDITSCIKQ